VGSQGLQVRIAEERTIRNHGPRASAK
jgi:hypothetical protein